MMVGDIGPLVTIWKWWLFRVFSVSSILLTFSCTCLSEQWEETIVRGGGEDGGAGARG